VGRVSDESTRPLGEWLRQRREELGISLEQAQAETRIRVRYLKALEGGEYESLPDPVVSRGFLRNYATYLGLDVQEASRLYAQKVAAPEPVTLPSGEPNPFDVESFEPVPLHQQPGRGRGWLWVALAAVLALVALAIVAWWYYPWISSHWPGAVARSATQTPTLAAPGQGTLVPATPSATPSQPALTTAVVATQTARPSLTPTLRPSLTPTPSPVIYTGIFLELVLSDTSWIQVTVDGLRKDSATFEAGTYKSYYGDERIELRIGNAGAVALTLNGQKLGTLGGPGEVADRVFEKVGEQVGAATLTPEGSPTATPRATRAPTQTPPAGSATPAASRTPATPTNTPTP
jgi:cytoskeleton protein RodZ